MSTYPPLTVHFLLSQQENRSDWEKSRRSHISTATEVGNRRIDPLVIVPNRDYLCLRAYCHLRQDERTFRLDRITERRIIGKRKDSLNRTTVEEREPYMKEYEGADAIFYDYCFQGVEGDMQFYIEEARKAGSPVLELGCGTGRILLPTAEAGMNVVGLDRSPTMLSILRRKLSVYSTETQSRVELLEGDMRHFSLGQRFKLVMIPFRAFLHLLTPKDQRQTLTCIHEHLTDDGRLVFNVFDPDLALIAAHLGPLGSAMKKDSEFIHPDTGRRVIMWFTGQYDPERQMLDGSFIFEELDEQGRVVAKTYSPLTLRYVYRYEMRYLLELCGYKVEALYGDFRRGPFRAGGEQIWVARKG